MNRRIFSLLLGLCLCLGLLPTWPAAWAEGGVPIDAAHFPDDSFRALVGTYDLDGDGQLSEAEIDSATTLQCSNMDIHSLSGLSWLSGLYKIVCSGNPLQELDVSQNKKISMLDCDSCQLNALDVSHNPRLRDLYCSNNELTELDLTQNPEMDYLVCSNNCLTALNISGDKKLRVIICDDNQLTSLDLTTIEALAFLRCAQNCLTALDVSGNPLLDTLGCAENQLTELDLSNCPKLRSFSCNDNMITSLNLENFSRLFILHCENNALASLNVSNCPALTILNCSNNQLTSLDTTQKPKLEFLDFSYNRLTEIDLTGCPKLDDIRCVNNQLIALDLTQNPLLKILDCDNNRLTSLDLTQNTKLKWIDCAYNQLTTITFSNNPELEVLCCSNNQLTELDLSSNPQLKELAVFQNPLSALDLSWNPLLYICSCFHTQIRELDLTANPILQDIWQTGAKTIEGSGSPYARIRFEKMYPDYTGIIIVSMDTELYARQSSELFELSVETTGSGLATLSAETAYEGQPITVTCAPTSGWRLESLVMIPAGGTPVDITESMRFRMPASNVTVRAVFAEIPSYPVKLETGTGGTAHVSADRASEGDAVTVTAEPAAGWRIEAITYTPKGGNAIDITQEKTFVMPAAEVTVRVSFTEIVGYPIQLEVQGGGTAWLSMDCAREGETVTVHCEDDPAHGWELDKISWKTPDGESQDITGTKQFTMPAEPVQVEVRFRRINPFVDNVQGKYYYNSVLWAYWHDPRVTSGTDETHFGPNRDCTREQIVAFLYAAYSKPAHEMTESPFTDVTPSKYYYHAVMWAVENDITGGVGSGKFGVGRPCTREQVVTFLWKAAGAPAPQSESCPFEDVKPGKYYYKAVLWAVENGVTGGMSATSFGVGKTCTRAQVVTFLYKAVGQNE